MHGEESSGAHGVGRHVIIAELSSSPLMGEKTCTTIQTKRFQDKGYLILL